MILQKLLILVFLAVAVCVMGAGVGAAAVITVDDSGGADFTSIQAAVDAASEGDTIEVASGTYVENVDINKRLTLVGAGQNLVKVEADNSNDHVFYVTTDGVSISGFTLTGATGIDRAGIRFTRGGNFYDNTVTNNYIQYFAKKPH